MATTVELAWFAGFFDARGLELPSGVRVNAINFEERLVLDMFKDTFGGHVNITTHKGTRRGQLYWLLTGKKAEDFLEAIQPYRLLEHIAWEHALQVARAEVRDGKI